jgi:hypothetical protein
MRAAGTWPTDRDGPHGEALQVAWLLRTASYASQLHASAKPQVAPKAQVVTEATAAPVQSGLFTPSDRTTLHDLAAGPGSRTAAASAEMAVILDRVKSAVLQLPAVTSALAGKEVVVTTLRPWQDTTRSENRFGSLVLVHLAEPKSSKVLRVLYDLTTGGLREPPIMLGVQPPEAESP